MILDIPSLCTWLEAQQMLGWAEHYRARLHIFSIIYDVSGNSCSRPHGMVRWQGTVTGVDQTIITILDAGFSDQLVIILRYY